MGKNLFAQCLMLVVGFAGVVSAAPPVPEGAHVGKSELEGKRGKAGMAAAHDSSPETSYSLSSYNGGIANLVEAELKKVGLSDVIVDPESITSRPVLAFLDLETPYRSFKAKDRKTGATFTGRVLVKTYEGSVPCNCGKEAMPHYKKAYMAAWDNKAVPVGGIVLELSDSSDKVVHTRATCDKCK